LADSGATGRPRRSVLSFGCNIMIRRDWNIRFPLVAALTCLSVIVMAFRSDGLPPVPAGLSEDSAREVVRIISKRMRGEVVAHVKRLDFKGSLTSIVDYLRYRPSRLEVIPIPGDPNPLQVVVVLTRRSEFTTGISYKVRLIHGEWTSGNSVRGRWKSRTGDVITKVPPVDSEPSQAERKAEPSSGAEPPPRAGVSDSPDESGRLQ
jgi:hypothetical protein